MKEGQGCNLRDIDGNSFIDYVASYGPLIVGHANDRVVAALSKAIGRGTSFGAPSELETQLAGEIVAALPAVEMIRFVNSGTEATMSAIRVARAATGRSKIIKCLGCYHGHSDGLLVQAGSGALTLGTPSSPGIPTSITSQTVLVPYNDLEAARAAFDQYPNEIAGFIIEPVTGNMGVVAPAGGYLQGLRDLCDQGGALLIFDEVMTGFRVAWGGAQTLYRVQPDLTCLGKIIGGGLPVGAYGGRKKIMEMVSPSGSVYQAGTLSGNPLAMSGGLATLEILKEPDTYETLEARSAELAEGIAAAAAAAEVPLALNRVGSMFTAFFLRQANESVTNYAQATASDVTAYGIFFHAMLDQGIYLPPSQYEAIFVGLAHTAEAIAATIEAAKIAMPLVRQYQTATASPAA
jgi:glutamate-1-semialdehyde 2,1-aminomutase